MLKSVPHCRTKFHNYYLRKRRKWPHPVYKSRWHQKLSQQNAMQSLLQQSSSSINLLSTLTNSFSLYNCNPTPNSYHFIIKTLIKTSQSHQIPSVLNHLKNHENFQTPESILTDLIEFYGQRNEFQKAIELFFNAPGFRCAVSVNSLNRLLSVLCRRKESWKLVPQVLVKSRLVNVCFDESTFVVLVNALCKFKKPLHAIGLLRHMVDVELDVDRRSFRLVLCALCRENGMECDEVMLLVEELKKLGFCFEGKDWVNVIRFLVRRKKGVEALDALRNMKLEGFKPDVFCYTMVLDGLVSVGEYGSVEHVFDEMLTSGLVPDVCTYNVYVNGLCEQNKFDDGVKMVMSMEEIGCKPDMITYNMLLFAICERGEVDMARCFFKHVRGKGGVVRSETYEKMICRMTSEGEVEEGLDYLKEMVRKRLVPQPSTVDEVISSLCENGLVSNGMDLLVEMLGKNVIPGCRSWEALIVGFQMEHGFKEIDLFE